MATIKDSIFINAPVEKVFEYHTDPRNNAEYWPSFQTVKDIEELPSGGTKFGWVYKMAGVKLEGTSETTEFIPNERYVVESKGGVESTFIYEYKPEGDGTRLSVEVEYAVPVPVLGKLAETIIVKMNERESKTVLANIKDRLEG
jgi:ligand-binding SRPBCC domain-containing protein